MQRGMRQAIAVSLLETCLFISSVFTLYLRMMWFLGLYSVSQRERNTDRMGMSKFKTRITFPTDPSDFVTGFILRSQCSFHVVLTLAKASSFFCFFFFFISPRLASSAAPSGTVRIEVNMSVWNEMLPISCGRSRLYVACYSRRNNTAARMDLWSNLCENMDVWLWSEISWGKKKWGENCSRYTVTFSAPRFVVACYWQGEAINKTTPAKPLNGRECSRPFFRVL